MNVRVEFVVPVDHPSLPGHFPGAPIVPGVVILDEVQAAIARSAPTSAIAGIRFVKFLSPLLPTERATVQVDGDAPNLRFRCLVGERVVATGALLSEVPA